jgi:hypothetical protein
MQPTWEIQGMESVFDGKVSWKQALERLKIGCGIEDSWIWITIVSVSINVIEPSVSATGNLSEA